MRKVQLERERLLADKESLENELQRYKQQCSKLQIDYEQSQNSFDRLRLDCEKLREKYESCQFELQQSSQEKEKLLIDFQRLQNERAERDAAINEVNRLRAELQKLSEKQYGSKNETMQLKGKCPLIAIIFNKFLIVFFLIKKELNEQHLLEVEELQRNLESANNRLEKYKQAENRQKSEIERVMIEFEKLRDKMERNSELLIQTQKEKEALQMEIKQMQAQLSNAGQTNKDSAAFDKEVQEINAKFTAEINRLKQLLVKSESDLAKTLSENNRLQIEIERLKQDLEGNFFYFIFLH